MGARGTNDSGGLTELEQARAAHAERRWDDAYRAFAGADEESPLGAEDLDTFSWCAALTGRDEELLAILERLYQAHEAAGRDDAAGRAAFWVGLRLFSLGEPGRAGGWLARARRCVERQGVECAVRGYLLLPRIQRHLAAGEDEAAQDLAAEAAAIGERCGEPDLIAFARNLQARALMRRTRVSEGLALLDEMMLAVTSGELGPLVTGLVFCSVIASCHQVYALDRAREWTAALGDWCDEQPQLVTFTGQCLVHRAELAQLGGAWSEAAEHARRATERFARAVDAEAVGDGFYQQAEVHRLRGEPAAAEQGYRDASRFGNEAQPGLALLRLDQGQTDAAAAALRRILATTAAPLERARVLPACVEVALAAGAMDEARAAADELSETAERYETEVLGAMAAQARGAVRLAAGDAQEAIAPLRGVFRTWQRLGAPHVAARVRVLLGIACGALGDEDGKRLELEAARRTFEELGAAPELARVDALLGRASGVLGHGLTPRELEVLRLVAAGRTNKAIARALQVSERTIDRHVSNIFAKIDVSSRAAATAFAYERRLV